MKINNRTMLEKINFSDFEVINMSIDKSDCSIAFTLSGGLSLINGKLDELGKGYLGVIDYDSIDITSYNAKKNIKQTIVEDSCEHLKGISEIEVVDKKIIIKGFAKETYNWIEIEIMGGEVKGDFPVKG